MALVVEHKNAEGAPEIVGIGRLSKLRGRDEAELAVLVDDRFQHLGMGTELYRRLIAIAHAEKVGQVVSTILVENHEMRAICQKLGFVLKSDLEDGTIRAELSCVYEHALLAARTLRANNSRTTLLRFSFATMLCCPQLCDAGTYDSPARRCTLRGSSYPHPEGAALIWPTNEQRQLNWRLPRSKNSLARARSCGWDRRKPSYPLP